MIDFRNRESNGKKWILHAKDHFSKVSRLYALPSNEGQVVAKFFKRYVLQNRAPCIVQTDHATEFVNETFQGLLAQYQIIHVRGDPKRPKFMGLIERSNREVKLMISVIMERDQRYDWDNYLIEVESSINNKFSRTIGCSPLDAMYLTSGPYKQMRQETLMNEAVRRDDGSLDSKFASLYINEKGKEYVRELGESIVLSEAQIREYDDDDDDDDDADAFGLKDVTKENSKADFQKVIDQTGQRQGRKRPASEMSDEMS